MTDTSKRLTYPGVYSLDDAELTRKVSPPGCELASTMQFWHVHIATDAMYEETETNLEP